MENGVKEGVQAPSKFNRAVTYISRERETLLGCVAVSAGVGMLAFAAALETSSTETDLGGHRVIVEATRDGRGTMDLGFISARTDVLDTSKGFGAKITVKEALNGFEASVKAGGEILQDPYETLTRTEDVIVAQGKRSAAWGVGIGLLAGMGAGLLRRNEHRKMICVGGVGIAVVASGFASTRADSQVEPAPWINAKSFILQQYQDDVLKNLPPELQGAQIRGISEEDKSKLVDFAEEKLIKPQQFVAKAWQNFTAVQAEKIAPKQTDEFRVGILSDMHNNVFMADLAGKTLNAFNVDGMVVAGDSAGSGTKYEQFVTKSIVNNTEGIEFRGDIIGNHDTEESQQPFRDAGFIDLNDGTVKDFGPLTATGIRSNQYTALGRDTVELGASNDVVAQELADEACKQSKPVNFVVVHEPQRGDRVVAQACAEVLVAGHMHDQVNPTPIQGENGTNVYRMINGTTGGAESAFTYGEPVNPADITFLTYKIGLDGQATFDGWQHVRYIRSGRVTISDYTQVAPAVTAQQLSEDLAIPAGIKRSLR